MDIKDKLELIADVFEEDVLEPETRLDTLENWDSMGKLSLIVMCDDEFEKKLTSEKLKEFETVQDILDFIG